MSKQTIILNCYSDLCKVATSYYLNPTGVTHLMFLRHAKELLQKNPEYNFHRFLIQLEQIEKEIGQKGYVEEDICRKADKIHTLGTLLKFS